MSAAPRGREDSDDAEYVVDDDEHEDSDTSLWFEAVEAVGQDYSVRAANHDEQAKQDHEHAKWQVPIFENREQQLAGQIFGRHE